MSAHEHSIFECVTLRFLLTEEPIIEFFGGVVHHTYPRVSMTWDLKWAPTCQVISAKRLPALYDKIMVSLQKRLILLYSVKVGFVGANFRSERIGPSSRIRYRLGVVWQPEPFFS